MKNRGQIATLLMKELTSYTQARSEKNYEQCVHHLGRAHVLSQRNWFRHIYVHFLMLEYSWARRDWREVMGQIIRLVATVPGHLFKKLPIGNTGWSNIPIMKRLPLPNDFARLFED